LLSDADPDPAPAPDVGACPVLCKADADVSSSSDSEPGPRGLPRTVPEDGLTSAADSVAAVLAMLSCSVFR
jgi:hypothetical protein